MPGDDSEEGVAEERRSEVGTFARVDFAERAIDLILLVSESRGAEVGPGTLGELAELMA